MCKTQTYMCTSFHLCSLMIVFQSSLIAFTVSGSVFATFQFSSLSGQNPSKKWQGLGVGGRWGVCMWGGEGEELGGLLGAKELNFF